MVALVRGIRRRGVFKVCPIPCHALPVQGLTKVRKLSAIKQGQELGDHNTVWWGTSAAGVFCQENIAHLQLPKDFQPPL